jgi:hypothetical protein
MKSLASIVIATLVVSFVTTTAQAASPLAASGGRWERLATTGPGPSERSAPRTLIERWNGTARSTVNSPNTTPYYNELYAVDATSATDAWAVGYANGASGVNGAPRNNLALHWNGTAWSVVSTPNPGVSGRQLSGVEAITPTNAWAVGWYYESLSPAFGDALVLHWNGTAWSQTTVPVPGNYLNQLYGVSASSASDIWAVGTYANLGEANGARHPLALHYDGASWSVVPMPTSTAGTAYLRGVKTLSPTDAWAVGSKAGYSTPVAYHWDGRAWTEVPTPPLGTSGNNLFYGVPGWRRRRCGRSGISSPAAVRSRWWSGGTARPGPSSRSRRHHSARAWPGSRPSAVARRHRWPGRSGPAARSSARRSPTGPSPCAASVPDPWSFSQCDRLWATDGAGWFERAQSG